MRPFYDLASLFSAHIRTAEEEAGRVYEPMVGVVTDNRDPQRLGRVKIKFPVLSEQDTSYWAPVVMLGAGKNRGWFFIPEVDDEVLVMFEHGDMNRPVVVGALWNGKDKPSDKNPGGNPRRVIKSRAGSKIIFDDDQMKLVIEDGTGKGRIMLDSNANKIVIEALDGDVCFQAPQGDIRIVAATAQLSATQNVEIHAGKAMAWGTDASASIQGGSGVELSGAKVNLNCGNARAPEPPKADPQDIPDPYEARGSSSDGGKTAAAQTAPQQAPPTTSSAATSTGPSSSTTSNVPPLEPQPVLVSAKWSQARAPVSTSVSLSAVCADMPGKSATFTIRDADDEGRVVTTLHGTCSDAGVEATWTTPSSGPPATFLFHVEADGKEARSDVLTVVKRVEAKLVLDDEPASNVRVRLRSEASGETLSGTANEDGVVVFEEAALGEHTLLLEEEG